MLQTIDEFLADNPSAGPAEISVPSSEFKTYDAADLDVVFLLGLVKMHSLSRHVLCIPNFYLCLYTHSAQPAFIVHEDTPNCAERAGAKRVMKIRAGAVFLGIRTAAPKFFMPKEAVQKIHECTSEVIVCNMGIYATHNPRSAGHANAFVFNSVLKTIERFDPMGTPRDAFDRVARKKLKERFPHWNYVGMNAMLARHPRGPQRIADAFRGLCVTYSLWYTLLRILNPSTPATALVDTMLSYTPTQLRNRALRLNGYAIAVLKRHPRGTLVRHGRTTTRNVSCRALSDRRAQRARSAFRTPSRTRTVRTSGR